MKIIDPTTVTTSSITAVSASTWMPSASGCWPKTSQLIVEWIGSAPPSRRKKTISPKARKGSSGISQASAVISPLHHVDLVDVNGLQVPVDRQHQGQTHRGLAGRQGDDDQGEDVPRQRPRRHVAVEGHEVNVGRVEHQLDAHQNGHGVAAGEDAVQPQPEEQGTDGQVVVEADLHPSSLSPPYCSRRAMTSAPTSETSSTRLLISNARMKLVRNAAPTAATLERGSVPATSGQGVRRSSPSRAMVSAPATSPPTSCCSFTWRRAVPVPPCVSMITKRISTAMAPA